MFREYFPRGNRVSEDNASYSIRQIPNPQSLDTIEVGSLCISRSNEGILAGYAPTSP